MIDHLEEFWSDFRAQLDELQRKQDQINSYKNSKSTSTPAVHSRETYGESPAKKSFPTIKSSRSFSVNRPLMKRLTAVLLILIFPCHSPLF